MWSRVGHKSGVHFRCDLCGRCKGSLCDLIPHLRRCHCVADVEPHFALGLLYGVVDVTAAAGEKTRATDATAGAGQDFRDCRVAA